MFAYFRANFGDLPPPACFLIDSGPQ